MRFTFENLLKDLGLRIGGAVGAVALFVALAYLGDFFNIELLQSPGGILSVILIGGTLIFFPIIGILYLADRI